jgi:hypothetical protein
MNSTTCYRGRDIPKVWRYALEAIALGKAGIAGAGLAIALLGALDIISAATAMHLMHYITIPLPAVATGGGVIGVIASIILNR